MRIFIFCKEGNWDGASYRTKRWKEEEEEEEEGSGYTEIQAVWHRREAECVATVNLKISQLAGQGSRGGSREHGSVESAGQVSTQKTLAPAHRPTHAFQTRQTPKKNTRYYLIIPTYLFHFYYYYWVRLDSLFLHLFLKNCFSHSKCYSKCVFQKQFQKHPYPNIISKTTPNIQI